MSKSYTYTNESFSGCDMVATILIPSLGNTPYVIGEIQTISYSIHMDRQPVRAIGDINVKDYVMGPRTIAGSLVFAVFNKHFANRILKDVSNSITTGYSFLIDEIPPFNIVISLANEYGVKSKMVIYGIRLINEGQVMSINDIYTENTYQFVATDIEYLNTDDSSVSNYNYGKSLYIIGDTNNKLTAIENESISETSDINPEIKYSIISKAKESRKGIIEIWITPSQEDGTIYVSGEKFYAAFDISNKNNKFRLSIESGEYQVYWSNESLKTNVVNLSMPMDINSRSCTKITPLIESVTENTITILSNEINHTNVICIDENGEKKDLKLLGRKATLSGLKNEHSYKIATYNINTNERSEYINVTTLKSFKDKYENFLNYINYNKNCLENNDFNIYLKVIEKAKNINIDNTDDIITDSFIRVKENYIKEINSLRAEDFSNQLEYQNEINKLKELIAACSEIIIISVKINNDRIYAYNYKSAAINPPIFDYNNSNTFIVNDNTNSLVIYKDNCQNTQLDKNLSKNNFKTINNKILCNFHGRPNTKYCVYAIDKNGYKSPRQDFYVLSNEEKAIALNNAKKYEEYIQYELNRANSLYGSHINKSFSEEENIRLFSEILRKPIKKNVKTPTIISITNDYVRIKIDDTNKNLMVVISDINSSLLNIPRYKIPVKNVVEFSVENHGLKTGNTYMIWIEDNNEQVSTPITFVLSVKNEELEQKEYNIQEYFINNITNDLETLLCKNNLFSSSINTLINKNKNEISNNKSNILDNILNDLIDQSLSINNFSDVLYYFFIIYMDNFYTINNDFFDNDVYINNTLNYITVPNSCTVNIFDISNNKLYKSSFMANSGHIIKLNDRPGQYSIIQFVTNDLSSRSGFILSKNYSNSYLTYKIKVKVGE